MFATGKLFGMIMFDHYEQLRHRNLHHSCGACRPFKTRTGPTRFLRVFFKKKRNKSKPSQKLHKRFIVFRFMLDALEIR